MTATMITALCTLAGSVISGIVALVVSKNQHDKTIAVVEVRLEQLEKKVEKHNNFIERVYECERVLDVHEEKIKVANHRIEDLEEKK